MVELNEVYITDYVRTPFSRSRPKSRARSAFSEIRGDQLAGLTLRNMFEVRLKGKSILRKSQNMESGAHSRSAQDGHMQGEMHGFRVICQLACLRCSSIALVDLP